VLGHDSRHNDMGQQVSDLCGAHGGNEGAPAQRHRAAPAFTMSAIKNLLRSIVVG
jgi:hypothetical protein